MYIDIGPYRHNATTEIWNTEYSLLPFRDQIGNIFNLRKYLSYGMLKICLLVSFLYLVFWCDSFISSISMNSVDVSGDHWRSSGELCVWGHCYRWPVLLWWSLWIVSCESSSKLCHHNDSTIHHNPTSHSHFQWVFLKSLLKFNVEWSLQFDAQ